MPSDAAEADRLYALPLEEFTAARDALAARLRSAGEADEARRVKGLRKPTVPAWTVDQLAHRQPHRVEALLDAGDRLRAAQQRLIEGGPASDVWEATLAEREIVGGLLNEAERILQGAGLAPSRGTLDRVADTLYAAAADQPSRPRLRAGTLEKEMRRAGFGDLLGGEPPTGPAKPAGVASSKAAAKSRASKERPAKGRTAKAEPAPRAEKSRPTARARLEAEREAGRLAREAERAETEAERLDRASERARSEADLAKRRSEAATNAAAEARGAAAAARKRAALSRRDAERSADRLRKLTRA
jgi:hypothetical protein